MYGAGGASDDGTRLVDLAAPLNEDVELWLLKEADEAALKVLRHSAAHCDGDRHSGAVFPRPSSATGRRPENGFFYDVYRETPFTEATCAIRSANGGGLSRATSRSCAWKSRARQG